MTRRYPQDDRRRCARASLQAGAPLEYCSAREIMTLLVSIPRAICTVDGNRLSLWPGLEDHLDLFGRHAAVEHVSLELGCGCVAANATHALRDNRREGDQYRKSEQERDIVTGMIFGEFMRFVNSVMTFPLSVVGDCIGEAVI